ncbi:hypothetical protein PAAG_06672 [Paracoccidioides lutzii Pb01]|uniref:Uncharacterized protein n=1 Tax=Paracoccidioides lutzii (strain ATCC MYA-826 / Pb01) TaxID=502779 RepID=C1H7D1_PARBA|nr:hypothetical protein PAAG_06672 [Paracoccidioides lutzii Pb01]EEH35625.2 hypothetical protein PAAG_06672 [Paracoccidioides lutzii Pb01]
MAEAKKNTEMLYRKVDNSGPLCFCNLAGEGVADPTFALMSSAALADHVINEANPIRGDSAMHEEGLWTWASISSIRRRGKDILVL